MCVPEASSVSLQVDQDGVWRGPSKGRRTPLANADGKISPWPFSSDARLQGELWILPLDSAECAWPRSRVWGLPCAPPAVVFASFESIRTFSGNITYLQTGHVLLKLYFSFQIDQNLTQQHSTTQTNKIKNKSLGSSFCGDQISSTKCRSVFDFQCYTVTSMLLFQLKIHPHLFGILKIIF